MLSFCILLITKGSHGSLNVVCQLELRAELHQTINEKQSEPEVLKKTRSVSQNGIE